MSREEFILVRNYILVYTIVFLIVGVYYMVKGTFTQNNVLFLWATHLMLGGVVQLYHEASSLYYLDFRYMAYKSEIYAQWGLLSFYCALITMVWWA